MWQRLEESGLGRTVISAFLVVTLFSIVTYNLPPSELRREAMRVSLPFAQLTGLEQVWSVFAPNPRQTTIDFVAIIEYSDGSISTWEIPQGDPYFGAYELERWRKFMEALVREEYASFIAAPTAAWIARQHTTIERQPIRVHMIRRWHDLRPPGVTPGPVVFEEVIYYRLEYPEPGERP
jgi:hypothetical protein